MKSRTVRSFLWIPIFSSVMIVACQADAAEKALYTAKGQRDPFVQLLSAGAKQAVSGLIGVDSLEDIRVEGVVADANPNLSIAIVNGTVMKSGEEIGVVKLLNIGTDGVLFSVNGVEGFKPLYQEN